MSIHGVGGAGHHSLAYQALMRSREQADGAASAGSSSNAAGSSAASGGAPGASAGANSPGLNLLSGANGFQAMTPLHVTGAVTATLPDGITLGIYSFAPEGSDQDQADSSSGSSASPSGGPDYASMASALEQMVNQFMASGFGEHMSGSTSSATAAAQSAYQQGASNSSTQSQATGTLA